MYPKKNINKEDFLIIFNIIKTFEGRFFISDVWNKKYDINLSKAIIYNTLASITKYKPHIIQKDKMFCRLLIKDEEKILTELQDMFSTKSHNPITTYLTKLFDIFGVDKTFTINNLTKHINLPYNSIYVLLNRFRKKHPHSIKKIKNDIKNRYYVEDSYQFTPSIISLLSIKEDLCDAEKTD